jgi:DNA-binding transcriptional LysR family regulator
MEIEELRAFVEVAEAGGVTAAAQRLGISKSMVSRRIHRLEEDLGTQLLARTTRGVSLTEAGTTFRDHAARVCAEIDVARETILPDGELRGRLRIAAPLSFGPAYLAPVLADMARRHPLLQMQANYSDTYVDLVDGGYDCAIRIGLLRDSNLIARRIGPIYGCLVASPEYVALHGEPQVPQDVVAHEALMQGTEAWQFMVEGKVVTVRPQGRFKADNATALIEAAVAGLGIAWVPDKLTDGHVNAGRLVRIMTNHLPPTAGVYVVRPPNSNLTRKVRVLTELLIECFG